MTSTVDRALIPGPRRDPANAGDKRDLAGLGDIGSAAGWRASYARALVLVDLLALTLAAAVAVLTRFGTEPTGLSGVSYVVIALGIVAAWSATLALGRSYEGRFLGHGTEEFTRVTNASVRLCASLAIVTFALDLPLARGFVAVFLPCGAAFLLLGRWVARMVVHAGRRRGAYCQRVLVVGTHHHVRELVMRLRAETTAGYEVVGACVRVDG